MIVNINGQYFVRDLGFIHTTKIKVDLSNEIQIQQGTMLDIGKIVHYHVDKITYITRPTKKNGDIFHIMDEASQEYDIDTEDFPQLRARPVWISPEVNADDI